MSTALLCFLWFCLCYFIFNIKSLLVTWFWLIVSFVLLFVGFNYSIDSANLYLTPFSLSLSVVFFVSKLFLFFWAFSYWLISYFIIKSSKFELSFIIRFVKLFIYAYSLESCLKLFQVISNFVLSSLFAKSSLSLDLLIFGSLSRLCILTLIYYLFLL